VDGGGTQRGRARQNGNREKKTRSWATRNGGKKIRDKGQKTDTAGAWAVQEFRVFSRNELDKKKSAERRRGKSEVTGGRRGKSIPKLP